MRSTMIIAVLITMSVMYTSATPLFGLLTGGTSGSKGLDLGTAAGSVLQDALGGVAKGVVETGAGIVHTGANLIDGTAATAGVILSIPTGVANAVADTAEAAVGLDQPKTTTVIEKTIIL